MLACGNEPVYAPLVKGAFFRLELIMEYQKYIRNSGYRQEDFDSNVYLVDRFADGLVLIALLFAALIGWCF